MTVTQRQAIWELCRQGFPLIAQSAELQWSNGQRFSLDTNIDVARQVRKLIDQCNRELFTRPHQAGSHPLQAR